MPLPKGSSSKKPRSASEEENPSTSGNQQSNQNSINYHYGIHCSTKRLSILSRTMSRKTSTTFKMVEENGGDKVDDDWRISLKVKRKLDPKCKNALQNSRTRPSEGKSMKKRKRN